MQTRKGFHSSCRQSKERFLPNYPPPRETRSSICLSSKNRISLALPNPGALSKTDLLEPNKCRGHLFWLSKCQSLCHLSSSNCICQKRFVCAEQIASIPRSQHELAKCVPGQNKLLPAPAPPPRNKKAESVRQVPAMAFIQKIEGFDSSALCKGECQHHRLHHPQEKEMTQ